MKVLLTAPDMHMWATFGASISSNANAIIYACDKGWTFKTIGGNLHMTIPDPPIAFIVEMQTTLNTRFSDDSIAKIITIKWISFYLMKTIKLKCLLRWTLKISYYAALFRITVRRKHFSAHRKATLHMLSTRISEVGIREKIVRLARFW